MRLNISDSKIWGPYKLQKVEGDDVVLYLLAEIIVAPL